MNDSVNSTILSEINIEKDLLEIELADRKNKLEAYRTIVKKNLFELSEEEFTGLMDLYKGRIAPETYSY